MNPPIDALHLPGDVAARLGDEARRCYPREACGFLMGERQGTEASVRRLRVAENRAQRPDRFFIDAREVFDAMRSARDGGQELLGVYHSHPHSGPEPSATDQADVCYEWLYLIVSVPSVEEPPRSPAPNMACWRWDGEQFAAVRLCATAEIDGAAPSRLRCSAEISEEKPSSGSVAQISEAKR